MASSAAFAGPIQSYCGQAYCASKVRPTIEPPSLISGLQAMASDFSENAETCIAVATDSNGVLRKLPPSASCGAKPMEWTTPSSEPSSSRTRPASRSRCSALVTSSSMTLAGLGSFLAMRSVSVGRGKAVRMTSAPCSWATLAAWNAMDDSISTPVMRMRLPSRIPLMVISDPCPIRRQRG